MHIWAIFYCTIQFHLVAGITRSVSLRIISECIDNKTNNIKNIKNNYKDTDMLGHRLLLLDRLYLVKKNKAHKYVVTIFGRIVSLIFIYSRRIYRINDAG